MACPALADQKICIGQFKGNCPSQPIDGYYPCGNDQKSVAQKVCTLYKDGSETKLGYRIVQVETKANKECIYEVFRVICEKE